MSAPPEEGLSARVWLDAGCTQIGLAMSRSIGDHAVLVRTPLALGCCENDVDYPRRSLAQTVGVIAQPEVVRHDITSDDRFMILATDGVWEFIPSQEAVDIVAGELEHGAEHACRKLIQTAAERYDPCGSACGPTFALLVALTWSPSRGACWWLLVNRWRQNEGDYRDDITAVVVVLPVFTPSTA